MKLQRKVKVKILSEEETRAMALRVGGRDYNFHDLYLSHEELRKQNLKLERKFKRMLLDYEKKFITLKDEFEALVVQVQQIGADRGGH